MRDGNGQRTALVTGGSRGIGLAISQRLRADGYAVTPADVNPRALGRLEGLVTEHGDLFSPAQVDISNPEQIQGAIRQIVDRWGRLDVLVNNAGRNRGGGVFDTSPDDWDWVLDTNLKGSFLCAKYAAEQMRSQGSGSIISISSTSAGGFDPNAAYSASKAGVIGLTRSLARELGPLGVRVNAIAPGVIETDWVKHNLPPEFLEEERAITPMGRNGEPEDIADVIAFLASDDARHVTGQVICVSGGRWMR